MKIIYRLKINEELEEMMLEEIKNLKMISHPNFIKIYKFFAESKYYFIVSQLCPGGNILTNILNSGKMMSELNIAYIMKQVLSTLYYCHQKNFVHGKIHINNIIFQDDKLDTNIKIIGVGGIPNDYENNRKLAIS